MIISFPSSKLIPGYRMVEIMAESSCYVVREVHEKCFNRTQFILRTVKAPNTFYVASHDLIKDALTSQVSHFSKSVFILVLLYHRLYIKQNIKRNIQKQTTEH